MYTHITSIMCFNCIIGCYIISLCHTSGPRARPPALLGAHPPGPGPRGPAISMIKL